MFLNKKIKNKPKINHQPSKPKSMSRRSPSRNSRPRRRYLKEKEGRNVSNVPKSKNNTKTQKNTKYSPFRSSKQSPFLKKTHKNIKKIASRFALQNRGIKFQPIKKAQAMIAQVTIAQATIAQVMIAQATFSNPQ